MRRHKRSSRVRDLLRREIADILMHRLKDPRIGFVTVTDVDLSDDLRNARVYVSVFKEEIAGETLEALKKSSGFIKAELGKRVRLRYMPELDFRQDPAVEYGAHMDGLLREIQDRERPDDAD